MSSSQNVRQDRTDIDDEDEAILLERVGRRARHGGMRVGDFVLLRDGDVRRVTWNWAADVQLTVKDQAGSFYFSPNGVMDYSGSLSRAYPKTRFREATGLREGACWIFHHDRQKAHNGVAALVPCRVYEEVV